MIGIGVAALGPGHGGTILRSKSPWGPIEEQQTVLLNRHIIQEQTQGTASRRLKLVKNERFEESLRLNLPMVWRLLRRHGLSTADADDGAQDVFWVFSQRMLDVPNGAERAFLAATALRVASERRRSKWYRSPTTQLDWDQPEVSQVTPDQNLEHHRRLDLLQEALSALECKEREVFVLSDIEEMPKSEVALALQIPEGTVASRLQRARQSFRDVVKRLQSEGKKL